MILEIKNKLFMKYIIFAFIYYALSKFPVNAEINLGLLYYKNNEYSHILNPLTQRYTENSEIRLPLYRRERAENSVVAEIIYPLFTYIKNEHKTDYQFFALFKFTDYKGHQEIGRVDKDWSVFPLIFAGVDNEEGNYFSVIPFGGNIRGKLGKDEIRFVMLPLYMKTRYKQIEIKHYLYPFFAYSNNSGDYSLIKIFPFYSLEKTVDSNSKTILWPFYKKYEKRIFRKDDELQTTLESIYIFPFYAIERLPLAEYKSYLYPLIKYKVGAPDEYLSVLPLFERIRADNYSKDSILLIAYNKTVNGSKKNIDLFYPLIRKYSDTSADEYEFYFAPIIKYRKNSESKRLQIFPLYKYANNADGSKELNIFALDFFLKDTSIEKNYARYWRILNYYRQNNDFDIEFLFSFLRYSKKNNQKKFSVFPIFSVDSNNERKRIDLFCGLLGFNYKKK